MLTAAFQGAFYEMKTLRNEFISSGVIRRVSKDGIEVTNQAGDMPIVAIKTPVKVAVYSNSLGFRMLAGEVYLSNRDFVRIINMVKFVESERRRFFRVDVDMSGKVIVSPEIFSRGGHELLDEEQIVPIRVKDVSLCGARIETDLDLKVGDEIKLCIAVGKGGEEEIRVIVRRSGVKNRLGRRNCGLEICELTSRAEQQLCSFLFAQQRLKLRKDGK